MEGVFEGVVNTKQVLRCGHNAGIDSEELLAKAGVSSTALENLLGQISYQDHHRIETECHRIAGEASIGLHQGFLLPEEDFGIIAKAVYSKPTVFGALQMAMRLVSTYNNYAHPLIEIQGETARLRLSQTLSEDYGRAGRSEYHLNIFRATLQNTTGKNQVFSEVRFRHKAKTAMSEYERIFQAPVSFGCLADELVFPADLISLPSATASSADPDQIQRKMEEVIADFPNGEILGKIVRGYLWENLTGTAPTVESTADALKIRPRTLQYRLRREGTGFHELLEEVRRDKTVALMAGKRPTLDDLAYQLGYSEPRAFQRAFRRWTSTTPSQFRLNQR